MRHMARAVCPAAVLLAASIASAAPAPARAPAELEILTTPAGATVSVDGLNRGSSPVCLKNVPPDVHLVAASLPGYVEARKTVALAEGQKATVTLRLEPITGLALILSEPPGADAGVNGADRGKTPLLLTDLPLGEHKIRLSMPGYQTKDLVLNLKDRVPVVLSASLTSDSAKLIISSTPEGADVVVNGVAKGKAPCTVDRIPAGEITVELAMEGFETYRHTLRLAAGEFETINAALKPIPAELSVVTMPDKARVYLNDEFQGESPVVLKNLAPGNYRVRVEVKGYDPMARTVELQRAQKKTEEFRLARSDGSIEIITRPAGADVSVDGAKAGTTAGAPDNPGPSEPLIIDFVPPGEHKITISKKGYAPKTVTVQVEKGGRTSVNETLMRVFVPDTEVRTVSGETYRGVLAETDAQGNLKLEIKPGVFKTIPAQDVRVRLPIEDSSQKQAP